MDGWVEKSSADMVRGDGMKEPYGIVVFGPNGSGKTTLGRELARVLGFKHMDIEDYYFGKSEIPYTVARPREEWLRLMLADIEKHGVFVMTGCTCDYGDVIPQYYRLGVHISAPHELRMERVKQRAYDMYGVRVLEGGDMYEQEQKFFDYVAKRPLARIDEWAATLKCQVIQIDGTKDWRENAAEIVKMWDCGSSPQ